MCCQSTTSFALTEFARTRTQTLSVIECFEEVATVANCAVPRKGNGEGASVDSARGAKAFIDALRSVRILETMTKEDAKKLKVEHHGFYFRSFNGKRNFAPPLDESDWFK